MKEFKGRTPKQQSFYMLMVMLGRFKIGQAYGMIFTAEGSSKLYKPHKGWVGW